MTRAWPARIAGLTFLFYIAVGVSELVLRANGFRTGSAPVTFARAGQQASAVVLALTLYVITRGAGHVLALLGMGCRLVEGVGGTIASLLHVRWNSNAIFFAMGSLIFSWLFLRGRLVPAWLARFGVAVSAALVVILPLQLTGVFGGTANWFAAATWLMWLPMLGFEVTLAFWLIVNGVAGSAEALVERAQGAAGPLG